MEIARKVFVLVCLAFILAMPGLYGCQTVYYGAMEKMGVHKRDIMMDRVAEARDTQSEAKEQFKSALQQFTTVLGIKGGDLEDKYNTLNETYELSEKKAEAVHDRIQKVESVSEALFDEWKSELKEYSSAALRKDSQQKLDATRTHYAKLISAMKKAEKKIAPVLSAFKDQVLYLKHNLNAQAIASLQNELVAVEGDIVLLVKEMEASIKEANAFIETLKK
nr:DUF2959 domain-containing protein [Desulfobulbaceae bacterium]